MPAHDQQSDVDAAPAEGAFHASALEAVAHALGSPKGGLDQQEAARRLARYGPNRLPEAPRRSALRRFLAQFDNLLIYVLLGAGVIAALLQHHVDAVVILAVVVLNAVIGFVQEGRAENALAALRAMSDPQASVMRGGVRVSVPAAGIVPGDRILLEPGDRVPADMRLVKATGLRLDEAALTGESVPVTKDTRPVARAAPLGDRRSMAYAGTLVAGGQGEGIAVATGGATELGHISTLVAGVETLKTPLVKQMDRFARQLTTAVLTASVAVFLFAWLARSYAVGDAFMVVVGLAVSAIPEGLPAVMTIALAVGVQRMAARNAIIRHLNAVETLGSVSVICSDKTGTLTRNEMTVSDVETADTAYSVTGEGYSPEGAFRADGSVVAAASRPELGALARAVALCSDARLVRDDGRWIVHGDPMEGALLAFALKAGADVEAVRRDLPRLDEIPFDARHRYMATLHEGDAGAPQAYIKGAPEAVLAMCREIWTPAGSRPLDPAVWHARIETLAKDGRRMLAVAAKDLAPQTRTLSHGDLREGARLLGLLALIDPPREDARGAVDACREAGISVKMITGDHLATASAIAREVGLEQSSRVATGSAIEGLSPEELKVLAREASVFARTSPEHKLRLVEALQADEAVIAMTGDGVNDAPALKRADVGVAMGLRGTEAAKEASKMVIADDNFASIVAAVREGRTVYDNIRKLIAWTLPTNGGEGMTIVAALLLGFALPVTPVQILWINLVTATALGLTLAFEPTEPGTMRRPPRPAREPLVPKEVWWRIGFASALFVAGVFTLFFRALEEGRSLETARTIVVNALVVFEIFYLFSVRFAYGPSLTWRGVLGTPAVLVGVSLAVVSQLAFTFAPPLQAAFASRPLTPMDAAEIVGAGVLLLLVLETEKLAQAWLARRRGARQEKPSET